jgi:hypothetical protein
MTESETIDIDNKKETNNTSNNTSKQFTNNLISFLKSVGISIISFLIYIILASFVLFKCKITQSNILPTNDKCFPYENTKPEIQPILTNIFIQNSKSEKLEIPYDKNQKNILIDMLRKSKHNSTINGFTMYFLEQFSSLFHLNYTILNILFNLINQLPEFIIILFGPIFTIISLILVCTIPIFSIIDFIYHYFVNMKWLFKQNTNTNSKHEPIWKNVSLDDPINYGLSIFFVFLCVILLPFLLFIVVPILQFFVMIYCLCNMLTYKGMLNSKPVNVFDITQQLFKNYKVMIMIYMTIIIITNAFKYLGTISGIFSIIVVLLIYFNIINIDLYKSIPSTENLTDLVSNDQAENKCSVDENTENKTSSIFNFTKNFIGGSNSNTSNSNTSNSNTSNSNPTILKGGYLIKNKILKNLKKISKHLHL